MRLTQFLGDFSQFGFYIIQMFQYHDHDVSQCQGGSSKMCQNTPDRFSYSFQGLNWDVWWLQHFVALAELHCSKSLASQVKQQTLTHFGPLLPPSPPIPSVD